MEPGHESDWMTGLRRRKPDRRSVLSGLAAVAGLGLATGTAPVAAPRAQSTDAPRIVIAGAGAAGLTAASLLAATMPRAGIVVLDGHDHHVFQPGYPLIGAGLWQPQDVIVRTERYVADGVEWVREDVAEFDVEGNAVVSASGRRYEYDFLVVATGLSLDYGAIEGMSRDLIGREGIASIYAGPEAAADSWAALGRFVEGGGVGLFGRPASEMKCAGAPLKYTFIADDLLRRADGRGRAELIYAAHDGAVFAVPPVAEKVSSLFEERGVGVRYDHVLQSIDPGARRAVYRTPDGTVELDYDFIHVVPPMHAPEAVRASPLPWQEGTLAADGWVELDRATLQHRRFPNVFGIGDVAGVPKGKTAASVKWQTPVVVENLVAVAEGREPPARYNGYTSCPLVTGIGRAMLVEFDYEDRLTPSFPFIDPLKELWVSWVIEERLLKPTYLAMLRGHI